MANMRDSRKDAEYFETFLVDIQDGINETQAALEAGNFTSPTSRVDIAQRIYQLAIINS